MAVWTPGRDMSYHIMIHVSLMLYVTWKTVHSIWYITAHIFPCSVIPTGGGGLDYLPCAKSAIHSYFFPTIYFLCKIWHSTATPNYNGKNITLFIFPDFLFWNRSIWLFLVHFYVFRVCFISSGHFSFMSSFKTCFFRFWKIFDYIFVIFSFWCQFNFFRAIWWFFGDFFIFFKGALSRKPLFAQLSTKKRTISRIPIISYMFYLG